MRRFAHTASRRSRRLLFLSFDWGRSKDPLLSLGQASMIANLKKHRIPVNAASWHINQPDFDMQHVYDLISKNSSSETDIAIGAYIWNEPYIQSLLQFIRHSRFPGRIILGGPQVSYVKHGIENYYPQADIFIRGYGEQALVDLMSSHDNNPIVPGVHYANEPDLGISASADLEKLPSPFLSGLLKPQTFMRWETQRGCPFRCSFCQHRESDVSMTRRQHSQSRIMEEISWFVKNNVRDIAILDPTFNSGSNYMSILEEFHKLDYRGKLSLQCRAEMIKPEFLDIVGALNQSGEVVLELGLQTIHKGEQRIIQRPNNMKKVTTVLQETKQKNIPTEVSLIFGLPGQTVQSFQASVDFCKELQVPTIYAFPLMLLRGTPLHHMKQELELQESSDVSFNIPRLQDGIPHVISSPSFTYEDWILMARLSESLDEYNQQQSIQRKVDNVSGKMSATLEHTLWKERDTTKNTKDNTKYNLQIPTK